MSYDAPQRPHRATGEEYADALSGLVEEGRGSRAPGDPGSVDHHHEGPREPKRSRPLVVFALLIALGGIVGWNVYYLNQPLEPAPPENQRRVASLKLYHAARAIEGYRAERGELPQSLSSLNVPAGDFDYVKADTGYVLVLRTPDTVNRYQSGDDLHELVRRAGVRGGG